jgi:hypothetical protein
MDRRGEESEERDYVVKGVKEGTRLHTALVVTNVTV